MTLNQTTVTIRLDNALMEEVNKRLSASSRYRNRTHFFEQAARSELRRRFRAINDRETSTIGTGVDPNKKESSESSCASD